jgi:hypothetical protein
MIVQKEINNEKLAKVLKNINEKELLLALEPFLKKNKPQLLKIGKHKPFKPFKAIKMTGQGPTASEMVIRDRI